MTLTLTEIAEIEQTEEYQLEQHFEQRMKHLDELLERLHARFARIHADDKEFTRHLKKSQRRAVICVHCGKENVR
jgi:hypothetical protein